MDDYIFVDNFRENTYTIIDLGFYFAEILNQF